MEERIPPEWRDTVCRILETGTLGKEIVTTTRIFNDWQDAFPAAFLSDLVQAMKAALTGETVLGKRIDQPESGITYAFWFYYDDIEGERRKMYGKICLKPDNKHAKLLSAHVPLRGDEL
jgi:hypothetical protein